MRNLFHEIILHSINTTGSIGSANFIAFSRRLVITWWKWILSIFTKPIWGDIFLIKEISSYIREYISNSFSSKFHIETFSFKRTTFLVSKYCIENNFLRRSQILTSWSQIFCIFFRISSVDTLFESISLIILSTWNIVLPIGERISWEIILMNSFCLLMRLLYSIVFWSTLVSRFFDKSVILVYVRIYFKCSSKKNVNAFIIWISSFV